MQSGRTPAAALVLPPESALMLRAPAAAITALGLMLALAPSASAVSSDTAALQVALRALGLYAGPIDGIAGPGTSEGVRRLQRRRGLAVDGIAGPRTRRALGRRGRPPLGSRVLRTGHRGWDVAALQFLLRRRGCAPGSIDGGFGPATASAVRRCQQGSGLVADGLAGPATVRALRRGGSGPAGPVRFLRPVPGPIGDRFGPRDGRMHLGLDFPAARGTPVGAAGVGVVGFAGWGPPGYGNLVIVAHRLGFETWYAHLASIAVRRGQAVTGGSHLGPVGSTGASTGPHLHFEARLNGTPFDPVPRLLG